MVKSKFFLMCFVFVFCLNSAVEGATPIDVNNFSFEFDNDGNQITCHMGIDTVLAWQQSGEAWVGVDPYCLGDADYDPCAIPENICLSEECYTDSHDGCHCWAATHGVVWTYIQATDRTYLYQELDPNDPNTTIVVGRKYTLTYDSMSEVYSETELEYLSTHSGFFYGQGGDANHVDIASTSYVLPLWIGDFEEWEHEWVPDLTMEWVCPPLHPSEGEILGLKFWTPGPEGSVRAYVQVDNVRLRWSWATEAYLPYPGDGAKDVPREVELNWAPGLWAGNTLGHVVYFSDDLNAVNNMLEDANQGIQDANSWSIFNYDGNELDLGKTYYWRIVEVNSYYEPELGLSDPPWVGDVWRFRVTGHATNPSPADEATDVPIGVEMKWTAGTEAKWHEVYFGTSFADVNDADKSDANIYQGPPLALDANHYDASGEHMLSETFYWRIDEVNEFTLKGDIWQFTVADFILLDDFDSYTSPTVLREVWNDGTINDTGSEVGVETETVRDGNSMMYGYCNWESEYIGYYSEIEAEVANLGVVSNWKYGGAESLVLWFYGDMDNSATPYEQMYVVLEDSDTDDAEVHYYGDMNDIKLEEWQEWNIGLDEFTDTNPALDLSDISKIYIGFGIRGNTDTPGDEGSVLFEDIALYPRRCVSKLAHMTGSFDGDCLTDYLDLGMMSDDWLLSGRWVEAEVPTSYQPIIRYEMEDRPGTTIINTGSLVGFDGTFGPDPCDPAWTTGGGYDGTDGLVFDNEPIGEDLGQEGDFVEIDPLELNSNTVSITAWIKRDGDQPFAPIVFTRGHDYPDHPNYPPDTNTTVGLGFGSTGPDGDPAWEINNELCYHWADAESSWAWHNEIIVPDGMWRFIALTVAPDEASLFMSDGTTIVAATNYNYHEVEEFNGPIYLGWDTIDIDPTDPNSYNVRHFSGVMDDVRIYDYTLTPGEVMGIAGLSGMHYLPLESWRTDADDDDDVDLKDFAKMAEYWLEEILFPML